MWPRDFPESLWNLLVKFFIFWISWTLIRIVVTEKFFKNFSSTLNRNCALQPFLQVSWKICSGYFFNNLLVNRDPCRPKINRTGLIFNFWFHRFPPLPANWGPKAAARMKLNKDVKLEPKKARKGQKRREPGQMTRREQIRENKRRKRQEKKAREKESSEKSDEKSSVGNGTPV